MVRVRMDEVSRSHRPCHDPFHVPFKDYQDLSELSSTPANDLDPQEESTADFRVFTICPLEQSICFGSANSLLWGFLPQGW